MADPWDLGARQLHDTYASGALSPVEVTRALISRIEMHEPALNAMYLLKADAALASATASEQRIRAGKALSPLDGVPITLKENLASAGDPTPVGTRANEGEPVAAVNSPVAARVAEAGCVLLGKTTMPDFGMLSAGLSSLHGLTRNPWRLDRNTSGSSSGAGAAAAARYAPLHIGTDIGGSVRLPAAHCGLFGHKPSLGRVPIYPPYLGRTAGPMTRTVEDAEWLMAAIARPDARDFMSLPSTDATRFMSARAADAHDDDGWLRGLRIGYLADMQAGLPVNGEVAAACASLAATLADAGASVEPMRSFMDAEMLDGMARFFEARSHLELEGLSLERRAKVLPFIEHWCTHRANGFHGRDVMAAYQQVVRMRDAAVHACNAYDFVISPVSPILPYEVERHCPGDDPENALPHIAFTVAYNMSEQPAASLNWTFSDDGLPIGVQVIGQRFDDLGVLRLSRLLETMRPPQRAWPDLPLQIA